MSDSSQDGRTTNGPTTNGPSTNDPTTATTRTVRIDVGPTPSDGESVQLWFLGVRHAADSFETRLFLDHPEADAATSLDDPSFAGSWSMYGHGMAADLPVHPVPRRTPAGGGPTSLRYLEPFDTLVDLTDALRRLDLSGEVAVTIVPVDGKTGTPLPVEQALPKKLRVRRD